MTFDVILIEKEFRIEFQLHTYVRVYWVVTEIIHCIENNVKEVVTIFEIIRRALTKCSIV